MRRTYRSTRPGSLAACAAGLLLAGCATILGIEDTHVDPPFDAGYRPGPDGGEAGPGGDEGGVIGPGPEEDGSTPTKPDGGGPVIIPMCDVTKPFSTPASISELNSGSVEYGGRYATTAMGTIYFTKGEDLETVDKLPLAGFVGPTKIAELNAGNNSTTSHFTTNAAETHGYFASSGRTFPTTITHLYETTRPAGRKWNPPTLIAALVSAASEDRPWLIADGTALYYDSDAPGGQARAIYRAPVSNTGAVTGPGVLVAGVDTAADELNAVVTQDELTMYFSRGAPTAVQIQRATRQKKTDPWGAGTPVAELNNPLAVERVTWVSPDGCKILMASTRSGAGDIFTAERPK